MKTFLLLILIYIAYLTMWGVICLVSYYLSIAFNKKAILGVVNGLGWAVIYLLNIIVGLGFIGILINLLLSKQFIQLVLLFIFSGFVFGIYQFVMMPFIIIPTYFATKLEDYFHKQNSEFDADIFDETGEKVVRSESSTTIKNRVAKYFVLVYFIDIAGTYLSEDGGKTLGDYVVMPALRIGLWTLIAIFIVAIYNLIRRRKFTASNKPRIFINTMRVILGISVLMLLIVVIFDFIN